MTRAQKKEWGDYLRSVGMAVAFSIPAIAFIKKGFFDNVPLIPKVLIWGVTFATSIYVGKSITPRIRFPSFLLTLLIQSTLLFVALVLGFGTGFDLLGAWDLGVAPWDANLIRQIAAIFTKPELQLAILASFVGVFIVSGVFQISRKLGPGVLRNWMLGKYHWPREEERIFMFLDMKDSTTLAERLGAIRFSSLVRDFFADLTNPLLETRAEVSHYIGDEAVITWTTQNGIREENCLRLFFLFQEKLNSRATKYQARYGLVPEFKAGAHIGPVVATEVGELKSEIVFHGDVLNTAARIQGMCSSLNSELLISGELAAKLGDQGKHSRLSLGRHLLKGKEHDVEIFAIITDPSPGPASAPPPSLKVEAR